ncbi:ABC transporter permease [Streptomyces sp. NPDC004539]|uniref:ABC transporter permease n=1 Tax=Streptomyces sp. NPDC004539 TaxID=3154280 RepID=UPI0033A50260
MRLKGRRQRRTGPSFPPVVSRLRPRDLLSEAALSLLAHSARSALTVLGVVLGCAAFVAASGIASTLSRQVSDSFDVARATQVVVRQSGRGGGAGVPEWQRGVALERVRRLSGVEAAGARTSLPERAVSRTLTAGKSGTQAKVVGVDAGALAVIGPRLVVGRVFDAFHERVAAPVVLLPAALARVLDVRRVGVAVLIGDRPYTVLGVFDDVVREPGTLAAAVVPFSAAQVLGGTAERDVLVSVRAGAARTIGAQAPLALRPESPGDLEAVAPPDPVTLRQGIESDVTTLALAASLLALGVGTFSIATAATAGVSARAPEIGLRRAVGARPGHVFVQLLAETTMLGAVGGVVGSALGVVAVVGVSLGNGWEPVLDLGTAGVAVVGGVVVGLVAGLLPGWRATRVEPVGALRGTR